MASVKIADVIVPAIFNRYTVVRTTQLSAFYQSGIIQNIPELSILGLEGGTIINMPFWNDLTGSEEILSDTIPLSVDKLTTGRDAAIIHARGKAWGANDLAKALSGEDPMQVIGDLVAAYWARRWQALILACLQGVFAASSMSTNLSDISGNTGDAAVFNASTFIDAQAKLGDQHEALTAIAMHSATEASLAKLDLIDYLQESQTNVRIPTFMGKRVIIDDSMPNASGVYTTYLFGPGAIGQAEGNAPVPTETDRDSLQGDDILINRRHFILHPRGVRWIGTPAGVSPTNTEVAVGTNWSRSWDNKLIRIVAFKHKLA